MVQLSCASHSAAAIEGIKMRRLAAALLILALPISAAHAQSMPVSTFLAKAEALKKRGPLALLSRDYKLLKAEIGKSAKILRAQQLADRHAGRRPATCIPNPVNVEAGELLRHFQSIPAAQQRGTSVKAAFTSLMNKKHPCR
jgi:hypothetical protein